MLWELNDRDPDYPDSSKNNTRSPLRQGQLKNLPKGDKGRGLTVRHHPDCIRAGEEICASKDYPEYKTLSDLVRDGFIRNLQRLYDLNPSSLERQPFLRRALAVAELDRIEAYNQDTESTFDRAKEQLTRAMLSGDRSKIEVTENVINDIAANYYPDDPEFAEKLRNLLRKGGIGG